MSDPLHAQLDWDANGQPLSAQFGDVYFSRASGLAETHHVFLAGNDLERRLAALPAGGRLVIGETGFGTGLNFLCAWQAFTRLAPADARLHFVTVEKYPLQRDDLLRALALWPELGELSAKLLAAYHAIVPGPQRLLLDGGRVVLDLLVGDAVAMFDELDAQVDAWFLDGFSPAKNPQMWSPELFAQLARLSAPGATLATFTSAGFVRRGLIEAGFVMRKVPGHGHKREMLVGDYQGPPAAAAKPWFARPPHQDAAREAIVVGAGLAGCATAASLAARGWQVTLVERHAEPAQEASGNPQGVLYLKLSAHATALTRLVTSAFGFTRRLLPAYLAEGRDWSGCGVLQLAFDEREAKRQAQLAEAFPASLLQSLTQAQAEALAGVALPAGGLFFPEAGWARPPALCRALAQHPNIRLVCAHEVLELRRDGEQWLVEGSAGEIARAPVLVLANAADAARFPQAAGLPFKRIRGQVSRLPATAASADLRTVVCAEGYVAPANGGEHTLGATFDFQDLEPTVREADHRENLRMLEEISADLAQRLHSEQLDPAQLQGRSAHRCTSPDYLPIVGPLAEPQAFEQAYAVLGKDARQVPATPCPWQDGLYLNLAHGSRGVLTAPLAAELLAAWLNDEPLPLPRSVAEACHPNRFALRRLIRGG